MNNKARGSYYERRVRDILIKEGAILVAKCGASLGPFDLWAFDKNHFRLVQVKSNSARLKPSEREEIKSIQVPKGTTKEYWRMIKNKKPLIELL